MHLSQKFSPSNGLPDAFSPCSLCPNLLKNLNKQSSERNGVWLTSIATNLSSLPRVVISISKILSLKNSEWPTDKNRRLGILLNISFKHAVESSVEVKSSSSITDCSHGVSFIACSSNSQCCSKSVLSFLHLPTRVLKLRPLTRRQKLTDTHSRWMQLPANNSKWLSSTKFIP